MMYPMSPGNHGHRDFLGQRLHNYPGLSRVNSLGESLSAESSAVADLEGTGLSL